MSNFKVKNKKKEKTDFRDSTTLDSKHKEYSKLFNDQRVGLDDKLNRINEIENKIEKITEDKNISFLTDNDLEMKADLLNELDTLKMEIEDINKGKDELDYYDKIGEIVCDYYTLRDDNKNEFSESKNIIDWFSRKKNKVTEDQNSRSHLLNKYCQRVEGIRTIKDDGSNRIKYCKECGIEKTLDFGESTYVCTICGDSEEVILDEDRQTGVSSIEEKLNIILKDYPNFMRVKNVVLSDTPFTYENGLLTYTQKIKRKSVAEHFKAELDRVYKQKRSIYVKED